MKDSLPDKAAVYCTAIRAAKITNRPLPTGLLELGVLAGNPPVVDYYRILGRTSNAYPAAL